MDKASQIKGKLIKDKLIAVTQHWLRENNIHCEDESSIYSQVIYSSSKSVRIPFKNKSYIVNPRFCLFLRGELHEFPKFEAHDYQVLTMLGENLKAVREGMVDMSPLLRELLRFVADVGYFQRNDREHLAAYRLLTCQLIKSSHVPLSVPVPKETRLLRLYHLLMRDKYFDASLEDLAKQAGASSRTIERLIQSQLEMKFTDWRRLMRIQTAILLLSQGRSVTEVAIEVGYKSTSAFINAFREQMGSSPKQYSKK